MDVGELDLCKRHDKIISKPFAKRPKAKSSQRKIWKANYDEVMDKIMKIAPKIQPFNASDILKTLKLSSPSVAFKACNMLVKAGKLKSTGQGPGRAITVAPKHTNGTKAAAA